MKLVSAIMLTRGRPEYAAKALRSFLSQTYEQKELIIIDDSHDPSFREFINAEGVQYFLSESRSIADKRNEGCARANGQLVCSFDDDDWSGPARMYDQVKRIEENGKQVTGYHSMLFVAEQSRQCWKYIGDSSGAIGTSLMFRREWWKPRMFQSDPAAAANVGEDNVFVKHARQAGELISVDAGPLMVARIHPGNTSVKNVDKQDYRPVPFSSIPQGFFQ